MANVRGTAASEVIDAADGVTNGDDAIFGLAGDDTIFGLFGNDVIKGGAGADRIDGGSGVDTVDYTDSTVGVAVVLSTGIGAGGTAEGDTFISIENANGSAYDDLLVGSDVGSVLHGLNGNDTLVASDFGGDRLFGDNGDDRLKGGGGADVLTGGAGIDTADYSHSAAGVRVSLWENTT